MATIGTIAVSLKAQTDAFVSGMGKALGSVKSFAGAIPGVNAVFSQFGAILSGVAVAGAAAFVRSQANAIDETTKLADRLGTTTEALTSLQHAANVNGGGVELLNTSLEQLQRRLGEAAQGSGGAEAALGRLGITLDAIYGKDPAEQFRMIAEGMAKLETNEARAAVAADLFGKAGQQLLPTLALGRDGLDAMAKEAERLGITFSRVEAAKVEAANDALTRVGAVIQGIGRRLAVELAPYIEAAANAFTEWATSGEGMGAKVADAVGWVANAVAVCADVFRVLKGTAQFALGSLVTGFSLAASAVGYLIRGIEKVLELITLGFVDSNFGKEITDWADGVREDGLDMMDEGAAAVQSGFAGESSAAVKKALDDIKTKANEAATATAKVADANREAAHAGAEAALAGERASAAAEQQAKDADKAAKAKERMAEAAAAEIDRAERLAKLSAEDRQYADDILKIEDLRAAGLSELADRAEALLVKERERDRLAKEGLEAAQAMAAKYREIADAANDAMRAQQAADQQRSSLQDQVALLEQTNQYDRDRVRVMQELRDAIKAAGGDQSQIDLAHRRAELELAGIDRQQAEDAEREAKAAKDKTQELRTQLALVGQQLDITKRFANFGGTSLFGFGAGQVGTGLGNISGAAAAAMQAAGGIPKKPGAAAAAGGAGAAGAAAAGKDPLAALGPLKDVPAELRAGAEALKRLPGLLEPVFGAVRELKTAAVESIDRVGTQAAATAGALKTGIVDLRGRVSQIEDRLRRAGDLGVGG